MKKNPHTLNADGFGGDNLFDVKEDVYNGEKDLVSMDYASAHKRTPIHN